jgi:uncharacterized small protein (DUF1192 family)
MELTLTAPERDLLLALLRDELGRLKGEIYRTEAAQFKHELKQREATLIAIIGRLEASQAA